MRKKTKAIRIREQFVKKNFMSLLFPFVLPQLLLGLLFAWNIFQASAKEAEDRMENMLDLAAEDMERLAGNAKTVELYFQNSGIFLGMDRIMNGEEASYTDYIVLKQFSTMIQSMANSSMDIESIYLYFPNKLGRVYISGQGFTSLERMKDREWVGILKDRREESFIQVRNKRDYDFEEEKTVLSVFQKLKDYPGGIVFNYDMKQLQEYYRAAAFYPEQMVVIGDWDGEFILKSDGCPAGLAEKISSEMPPERGKIKFQGAGYCISSREFEKLHLKIAAALPAYVIYSAGMEHMQATALSLILLLLISGVWAWRISVRDYRRLFQVVQWFDLAAAKKPLPNLLTRDVYSQILQNIIQLFLRNNELESHLSEERYKKQVAELQALQYQINPHFLFNTLQTIRYAVLDETGKETGCAEHMLENLADIMRYSLASGEERVSLRQELENCRKYIEIQEERYQNRFQTEWDIDPALLEEKIPRLILQPLAENAVIHGLRKKKAGRMRIRVRINEKNMLFCVTDNGNGIGREKLLKLREEMRSEEIEYSDRHIGLQNVNLRLCLEYGEESRLHLLSREGMGTTVKFRIPLKQETETEKPPQ